MPQQTPLSTVANLKMTLCFAHVMGHDIPKEGIALVGFQLAIVVMLLILS